MDDVVAVYGGAFDPVTIGHEEICKLVRDEMGACVWMIPVKKHRFGKTMTEENHRFNMCELAARNAGHHIIASNYDMRGEFDGSMWRAMESFEKEAYNQNVNFVIVIGADNADGVKYWDRGDELRAKYPFVVVKRPLYLQPQEDWFLKPPHCLLELNIDCSSTLARQALAKKDYAEAAKYISPKVLEYIRSHGLYDT